MLEVDTACSWKDATKTRYRILKSLIPFTLGASYEIAEHEMHCHK